MTPDEHRKVSIVARNLWPDEDPGFVGDRVEWDAKLWKLYEALMKAELI